MNAKTPFPPCYAVIFLLPVAFYSCQDKSAKKILQDSMDKIGRIKSVEQIVATDLHDSADYFSMVDTSVYYFDFHDKNRITGAKYHIPGSYLSRERRTDHSTYDLPKRANMDVCREFYSGAETFYFPVSGTVDAFRRFLPNILADTAVRLNLLKDTTLYGLGTHYHVHFLLRDKNIKPDGNIMNISGAKNHVQISYHLFIRKRNDLPTEIKMQYIYQDVPLYAWTARTLRYDFKPQKPDSIWDITTDPLDFLSFSREKKIPE
jgi:hypothetical protein